MGVYVYILYSVLIYDSIKSLISFLFPSLSWLLFEVVELKNIKEREKKLLFALFCFFSLLFFQLVQ